MDSLGRYTTVAELVRRIRGPVATTVLDVGGDGGTARALPSAAVLALPVDMHLPFPDRSWDVVVAADVLEHVPVGRRRALVAECARVARDLVVICGPWQTPQTLWIQDRIDQLTREISAQPHAGVAGHRPYGRPGAQDFSAQPGYGHYLTLGVSPAELIRESCVVAVLAATYGDRPSVQLAARKLEETFGPLEQYGLPFRFAWLARRQPLPPAAGLTDHRTDFAERLVGCMPEIVAALSDVTSWLSQSTDKLGHRRSTSSATAQYIRSTRQHIPELAAELQRLGRTCRDAERRLATYGQQFAQVAALRSERTALRAALARTLR